MAGGIAQQLASEMANLAVRKGSQTPAVRGADWQTAVVTAVNADGTVDIGDVRARRLDTYLGATVGDQIMVTQNGAGNWLAIGRLAPTADNEIVAYTPTLGNIGGATFSTRTGWYRRLGKLVMVNMYVVVSGAGSGTTAVTITTPTAPSRTTRQSLLMTASGIWDPTYFSTGAVIAFTTGTGTVWDVMRGSNGNAVNRDGNLEGAHLLSGGLINIQGWYREA